MPGAAQTKHLPIETAPRDGTEILVFFPLRDGGPLALIPAHYAEEVQCWFSRGVDIPDPLYWLPRDMLPVWPPDPTLGYDRSVSGDGPGSTR